MLERAGLNSTGRQTTVHETIANTICKKISMQETKLENLDQRQAIFLGGYRLRNLAQRPTIGTRGGILVLWNESYADLTNMHPHN